MKQYKVKNELTIITNQGKELTLQPGSVFKSEDSIEKAGIEEVLTEPIYETYNPWWFADYGILDIWKMGYTGRGVKVAVLDSGIYLNEGYPHKDFEILPEYLYDATLSQEGMIDHTGHGLHISGIIKASNNGFGITGIAYDSEFYFAKVSNRYGDSPIHLINGVKWARQKKVDIINISRGYPENRRGFQTHKRNLEAEIKGAYDENIIVVCASGDSMGSSVDNLFYPARFNETISVGGVKRDKKPLNGTINFDKIELFAPGHSIRSTSTIKNKLYKEETGSSQAAAYVSGVSALLIQRLKQLGINYTVEYIKEILCQNANEFKIINPSKAIYSLNQ